MFVCVFVCPFVCVFVCVFVYVFVCMFVCVFILASFLYEEEGYKSYAREIKIIKEIKQRQA